MFDNILNEFADFPKVDILFYAPSSTYDASTGEMTEGYEYDYAVQAHGFQKSAVKGVVSDKVFDSVDYVFILPEEYSPSKTDILYYGGIWYKIIYPDNVGFADSVCVIGAQRINEQIVTADQPDNYIVW
ncbi:MAG: hypothetical protein K9L56_14545 [Clostridiales bacterium]|nr:hypothetical protein [Clostridiales bacterium]